MSVLARVLLFMHEAFTICCGYSNLISPRYKIYIVRSERTAGVNSERGDDIAGLV